MKDMEERRTKIVVFDPGHGGDSHGATAGGHHEEDVVLEVAMNAAWKLRDPSINPNWLYHVFLTRDKDIDLGLTDRLNHAIALGAKAFVSIHANAFPGDYIAHGVETYFRDDRDFPLAYSVQKFLSTYTGMRDRGALQDTSYLQKRLALLNDYDLVAALTEIGFMDNKRDREYMVNNERTIGEVIAHGVDSYFCEIEGMKKETWPI